MSKTPPSADENDELLDDDAEETTARTKPWDPSEIRVHTKMYSLRQVVDEIHESSIDLAPEFQRDYVWGEKQRTQLIESILLGIPLPAFYFNADSDGTQQVVDGVQRLTTIRDYATPPNSDRSESEDDRTGFPLSDDLEYLTDLVGKPFSKLDPLLRRRFHQTQIVVHSIDATSPADLKYDIFKRINTGGSPLKPQEIRHCMSKARSRMFLKKLSTSKTFKRTVPLKATKRMQDREMVLRFVAFHRLALMDRTLANYSNDETIEAFLLTAVADLDNPRAISDAELDEIETTFNRSLEMASKVFGEDAFRKIPKDVTQRARMSRQLFEIWTVALARANSSDEALASRIREAAKTAMTSDLDFIESYTTGTGNPERVRKRFQKALGIVAEANERAHD